MLSLLAWRGFSVFDRSPPPGIVLPCSWKADPHDRANFRNLCQYFRQRSFAFGTLQPYELPPLVESRFVKSKSKNASKVVREAVKGAKPPKKNKRPSQVSAVTPIFSVDARESDFATASPPVSRAYIDLMGEVSSQVLPRSVSSAFAFAAAAAAVVVNVVVG